MLAHSFSHSLNSLCQSFGASQSICRAPPTYWEYLRLRAQHGDIKIIKSLDEDTDIDRHTWTKAKMLQQKAKHWNSGTKKNTEPLSSNTASVTYTYTPQPADTHVTCTHIVHIHPYHIRRSELFSQAVAMPPSMECKLFHPWCPHCCWATVQNWQS